MLQRGNRCSNKQSPSSARLTDLRSRALGRRRPLSLTSARHRTPTGGHGPRAPSTLPECTVLSAPAGAAPEAPTPAVSFSATTSPLTCSRDRPRTRRRRPPDRRLADVSSNQRFPVRSHARGSHLTLALARLLARSALRRSRAPPSKPTCQPGRGDPGLRAVAGCANACADAPHGSAQKTAEVHMHFTRDSAIDMERYGRGAMSQGRPTASTALAGPRSRVVAWLRFLHFVVHPT